MARGLIQQLCDTLSLFTTLIKCDLSLAAYALETPAYRYHSLKARIPLAMIRFPGKARNYRWLSLCAFMIHTSCAHGPVFGSGRLHPRILQTGRSLGLSRLVVCTIKANPPPFFGLGSWNQQATTTAKEMASQFASIAELVTLTGDQVRDSVDAELQPRLI